MLFEVMNTSQNVYINFAIFVIVQFFISFHKILALT